MPPEIAGIHHVTAIAGDPRQNLHFYTAVLGLRLVKLTVNYDDPQSYHLYYGDALGRPGTLMTFFAWPGTARGRQGNGQVVATAFAVPEGSLPYWAARLAEHGVSAGEPLVRFDGRVLIFRDPDGLPLELVAASPLDSERAWRAGPVAPEHAIHGLHHVTLSEEGYQRTAALLSETLGFRLAGEQDNRFRYAAGAGGPGALVDIVCAPDSRPGRVSLGTVHHVAWRTPDDASQAAWRREIAAQGYNVTPVMDRTYFRSIYFREPGGVLFEIATDTPGMTVNEPAERLGSRLVLPAWLEPRRSQIEAVLPPLDLPAGAPF